MIAASRKARLSLSDNARVLLADYGSNPVDHRIALEVLGGVYNIELPTQVTTRILDLGANIGTSAIYFQRRFPNAHIACVEPSPGNLAMLERNHRLNALSVTIFDCAYRNREQPTAFFDTADPSIFDAASDSIRKKRKSWSLDISKATKDSFSPMRLNGSSKSPQL